MIDYRKKQNPLSYLSVLTVVGSRMCTTSAMPILEGFVPNFGCYLSWWISEIRWFHLERAIMIDYLKKQKTLSYLFVLAVIDSRECVPRECDMRQSRCSIRVIVAQHKPSNTS